MRKSIIFLIAVGLLGLLTQCEKEGTQAVMSGTPTPPSIQTMPAMTFVRAHGTDSIFFTGTAVQAGFTASANYYLEADSAGNQFKNAVVIASGVHDQTFRFTVSDLNGALIKRLPTDTVSTVEFRLRAELVATGSGPFVYYSETKTASVTTYGLPRLDLIGSGISQKIESPLGDGNYTGYVMLDAAKDFTLRDPDANVVYGGTGSVLAVNGAAIPAGSKGSYMYYLTVNTNALTYTLTPYWPSIVGAFTNWGSGYPGIPGDYFMSWNVKLGFWYATVNVPAGGMKFRLNADWGTNWGPGSDTNLPANGLLSLPNSSGNILVVTSATYFITLTTNGSSANCSFTAASK